MASSSSSSFRPSSSFTPNPNTRETHDVFLSFRGEDTRCGFTSHLYAALNRLNIRTYIDYNLERGDEISSTLLGAIERSKISIIAFSKNYATSKWCLDELVKIMECKRRQSQIVIPIFYDVDPSNVRHQTGDYAAAFARHEQLLRVSIQRVQRWRIAMTEAANLSGWDCSVNRMEAEIVEDVANDVLQKLNLSWWWLVEEERQIARQQNDTQLQLRNYLHTGNPGDFDDFHAKNQRTMQLKLENFLAMAGLSHWYYQFLPSTIQHFTM